jgi:DNA polymerase (family X)
MKIHKKMTNLEIAKLLRSIAASYKMKNEDNFKFRATAYERAADAAEHASSELKDLWDEGKLEEIAGIGKSISEHLGEIFKTGKSDHFQKIMKGLPLQMFDLMVIPGIGAKTAFRLVKELKISEEEPIKQLEKLAKKGEVAKVEGFGEESEKEIIRSIKEVKGREKRLILPYAENISGEVIDWIKKEVSVEKVDTLGSLRRKVSTIGDIDISVASDKPSNVIKHFINYPKAQRIIEKGERSASIIVTPDIQVDLKVQTPGSYGSLLQHFTGSKHHNIALREFALKKGLSLSEYGIKNLRTKKLKKFKTEEEFYNALNLSWIPPELREGGSEIDDAKNNILPDLVEFSDIKADLQIHSDFDIETSHDLGLSSMKEIVDKANMLNYEYIALTEHNPSHSKHNQNQIIDLIKRKKEEIEQINDSYMKGVKGSIKYVFNSLEIDILSDGKLPISDSGFELLDFALVSIHSSFRLSKEEMTKRIISALSHPKVKIFAHPSGRKLGSREGVELDWDIVFDYCLKNDKWLEINAEPMRLDLPDFLVKEAVDHGIRMTLGTDAHHTDHMDNMIYGVSVARRGWAEPKDIINTLNYEEFRKLL